MVVFGLQAGKVALVVLDRLDPVLCSLLCYLSFEFFLLPAKFLPFLREPVQVSVEPFILLAHPPDDIESVLGAEFFFDNHRIQKSSLVLKVLLGEVVLGLLQLPFQLQSALVTSVNYGQLCLKSSDLFLKHRRSTDLPRLDQEALPLLLSPLPLFKASFFLGLYPKLQRFELG